MATKNTPRDLSTHWSDISDSIDDAVFENILGVNDMTKRDQKQSERMILLSCLRSFYADVVKYQTEKRFTKEQQVVLYAKSFPWIRLPRAIEFLALDREEIAKLGGPVSAAIKQGSEINDRCERSGFNSLKIINSGKYFGLRATPLQSKAEAVLKFVLKVPPDDAANLARVILELKEKATATPVQLPAVSSMP